MIPWGLRIMSVPLVPDGVADLKSDLVDRWSWTLHIGSQILLCHLKSYYQAAIPVVVHQVQELECVLSTRADFEEERTTI